MLYLRTKKGLHYRDYDITSRNLIDIDSPSQVGDAFILMLLRSRGGSGESRGHYVPGRRNKYSIQRMRRILWSLREIVDYLTFRVSQLGVPSCLEGSRFSILEIS